MAFRDSESDEPMNDPEFRRLFAKIMRGEGYEQGDYPGSEDEDDAS